MRSFASTIDPLQPFYKEQHTLSRIINETPVIFNFNTGNVMTLNQLGAVIWEKLPASLSQLSESISMAYDAPRAVIHRDIEEFLETLQQDCFVTVNSDRTGPLLRNLTKHLDCLGKIEALGIKYSIPIIAKFELTYHCNLSCIHCANITERWRTGMLDTGEVTDILDQLYDTGTMLISFTGGEIFVRKDLWDIISYAHEKGFLIELLTNASLMTAQDVERLKTYRISNVQISIYGHNREIHDAVTKCPGSFEKSIGIIRSLDENNINISMVTPLMKLNSRDFFNMRALADRLRVEHSFSYPLFERDDGSRDVYGLRISTDNIRDFFLQNPGHIRTGGRDIDDVPCHAGINQCSISPFGDLYPCFHNILPMNLGNLRNRSLKDIWTNSEDLEHLRQLKIRDLKQCPDCPAAAHCTICPGLNMRANNSLLEPAPVCCHYAFGAKTAAQRHPSAGPGMTGGTKRMGDLH